jgi:hypothetical protein
MTHRDPATLSDEKLYDQLRIDADALIAEVAEITEGNVDVTEIGQDERLMCYLTHILIDLGIMDRAEIDWQGRRVSLLTKARDLAVVQRKQIDEMRAAGERVQSRAKLGLAPDPADIAKLPQMRRPGLPGMPPMAPGGPPLPRREDIHLNGDADGPR